MNTIAPAPANASKQLDKILSNDISSGTFTVCLAAYPPKKGKPEFARLQGGDKLTKYLRDVASEFIEQLRNERRLDAIEVFPFTTDSVLDSNQFEYMYLPAYQEIKQQIAALQSPAKLTVFDPTKASFISKIRAFAIVAQFDNQDPLYLLSLYSKTKVIRPKRGVFRWSDTEFEPVHDTLIIFEEAFDCLIQGDDVFVLDKKNFQKLFRYYDLLHQQIQPILDVIKQSIPMDNFDQFAHDCGEDLRKISKLQSIGQKGYVKQISIDDLNRVIIQLKLPIKTKAVRGKIVLCYNSVEKWALLKLLNDDYVQSLLTKQVYEADNKRVMGV